MRINRILQLCMVLIWCFGCTKDTDVDNQNYSFELSIKVNADSNIVSTGDTVWMESTIQGFIKDTISNRNIHFQKAMIYLNMVVRSWNDRILDHNLNDYDFVYQTQIEFLTSAGNAVILGLVFSNDNGTYVMKCGVVFNEPGLYSIDTDYLIMKEYFSDDDYYLGGGRVELEDINGEYKTGVLNCIIDTDERNMQFYYDLKNEERELFNEVNDSNMSKYVFIKVVD